MTEISGDESKENNPIPCSALSPLDLSGTSGPLRRFYENQNNILELYKNKDTQDTKSSTNSWETFGVNFSYASNIFLFAIKLWALVISGSMAMLASVLDSSLDILSGTMLFLAMNESRKQDHVNYPIGKERIQPIATIVFSCLMGMSAAQVYNTISVSNLHRHYSHLYTYNLYHFVRFSLKH